MSLSGIIHHSHLFTRLEIYHHIYFKIKVLYKASLLNQSITDKIIMLMDRLQQKTLRKVEIYRIVTKGLRQC